MFSACRSAKPAQAQSASETETTSKCDKSIKYYSERIKTANGQEVNFTTEITINPPGETDKRIMSRTAQPG